METKTICLRGLAEVLSGKELKNVLGGSGGPDVCNNACESDSECNRLFCPHCVWLENWPGKFCMIQA